MFNQDGAFVLHLKMVHTPIKVPDDGARMGMHSFSFWQERMHFKMWISKRYLRGAKYIQNTKKYQEVQCAEWCP